MFIKFYIYGKAMRYAYSLIYLLTLIILAGSFPIIGATAEKMLPMPEKNEEGVYTQPWF